LPSPFHHRKKEQPEYFDCRNAVYSVYSSHIPDDTFFCRTCPENKGETENTGELFMKAFIYSVAVSAMLAGSILTLSAEVPVAVVPLKGEKSQARQLETTIKQKIIELGGVSVVGENEMCKIMEIHERRWRSALCVTTFQSSMLLST
jgi:hypothetical protein